MMSMQTPMSVHARQTLRHGERASRGNVDAATDVRLARERLAVLSRLSEHAARQVDRAELALVEELRDRRARAGRVEAARRRLVDTQDAALDAFRQAQDAARSVTVLTRSLGGLLPDEPDSSHPTRGSHRSVLSHGRR